MRHRRREERSMETTGNRLLIVEDDMVSLAAMRALFGQSGWTVTVATTVADGLRALAQPPDWIILDLWLPDGDGETILRKVRDCRLPTRVAVVSGALDSAREAQLEPFKPDVVMPKPLNYRVLVEAFNAPGAELPGADSAPSSDHDGDARMPGSGLWTLLTAACGFWRGRDA
jgi:DNA-binding response OmpR family regulator